LRSRVVGALSAAVVGIGLLTSPSGPASAFTKTSGKIVVYPTNTAATPVQPPVKDYGYDLKQEGKAAALSGAGGNFIFGAPAAGGLGFTTVRIPIAASEAHRQPGISNIDTSRYEPVVNAIKNRIPLGNADLKVYASLVLINAVDGGNSLPSWVKNNGQVVPAQYAQLLFEYLRYMDNQNGIQIDVMGVDNENQLNEIDITPSIYSNIVDSVKSKVNDWNDAHSGDPIQKPSFIAPDNLRPDYQWLDGLTTSGWSNVGIVGTHYYSKDRERDALKAWANRGDARGKPKWQTEFHWNNSPTQDSPNYAPFVAARKGLLAAFDNYDVGVDGFTWWAFNPRCTTGTDDSWCDLDETARLHSRLIESTRNARPLAPADDEDVAATNEGTVVTRAFKRSGDIYLWIVNDTAASYSGKQIAINGFQVPAGYAPAYEQWRRNDPGITYSGVQQGTSNTDTNVAKVNVPANSITLVTLPGAAG
jgi:O-glycosyl hydrolase